MKCNKQPHLNSEFGKCQEWGFVDRICWISCTLSWTLVTRELVRFTHRSLYHEIFQLWSRTLYYVFVSTGSNCQFPTQDTLLEVRPRGVLDECAKLACDLSSTCQLEADGAYKCVVGGICDTAAPCKNDGSCTEQPDLGKWEWDTRSILGTSCSQGLNKSWVMKCTVPLLERFRFSILALI